MKFCSVPGAPTTLSQSIPNSSCPCRRVKSSNHCLSSYEMRRSANTLRVSCTHTRARSTAVDTLRWSVISIPCAVNGISARCEASGAKHGICFRAKCDHHTTFSGTCRHALKALSLGLAMYASRPGKNNKNRLLFAEPSAVVDPRFSCSYDSAMASCCQLGLGE